MINFNLICGKGHAFEAWFKSSGDFDKQQAKGLILCPHCDDTQITKGLMTPNLRAKGNKRAPQPQMKMPPAGPLSTTSATEAQKTVSMTGKAAALYAELRAMQRRIEVECDDVGDQFAETARKIHYGEEEERGIYGITSNEESQELVDEGITIFRIPWLPKDN